MKGRESGMPSKEMWEEFFDPCRALEVMGIDGSIESAADFGCGYGTFSVPVARKIRGTLYAFDIDPEMTSATHEEVERQGLRNVKTIYRDFLAEGTGLKDESVDYVMLFNILHVEDPTALLKEAHRILRSGGRLGIIHWNYDSSTPRGPSMNIRPKPEQCIQWAISAGFCDPVLHNLKPHHYGIVLKKESER